MTRADILITNIRIRDVALIERVPGPTDRIGIGPRYPQTKSWHGRGVDCNTWHRGDALKIQPELRGTALDCLREPRLRWENPGTCRILRGADGEGALGDGYLEFREPIASLQQSLLASVLEQIDRTG